MKHNWEYKRLGDICKILNGYAFKSSNYISNGGLRIIRIANVQEGFVCDNAPQFYPLDTIPSLSKYILYEGDLLMSLTGNVGRVGILPKEFLPAALNQRVACLRLDKGLSKKFIFHFLNNKFFIQDAINFSTGVAQLNLSTEWLNNYLVPVPPMEVQERIVAELDKINETIEDCRELLRNLDALKLSLFYDYFGDPNTNPKNWNISTFGEIGTFIRGGGFLKRDFVDFGIPCIHYGQIHTKFGEVVRKNLTYISEYTALKSKFAKPNDVILAITSEDLEGSCKSVAWLGDFEVAVGGHAAIFTHNQNPVFISFYTRSNAFCIEKEKYAHGSKVVEIRPKDIEKIPIYLPPLELQKKFAARIEQIEAQKKAVEQTIAELQTLLDSRMDYWFN